MASRSFKTKYFQPEAFNQSPEFIPDDPWYDEDESDDEDLPDYLAPVGGFSFLKNAEEVAPVNLLSDEEKQRIKNLGTQLFNLNPFSVFNDGDEFFLDDCSFDDFESIVESKLSSEQLRQRVNDPETVLNKFVGGLVEMEKDHDFSDPNLTRMVFEDIKEPMRQLIRSGQIKMDITEKNEDSTFLKSEIFSLIAKKRKAFTKISDLAKYMHDDVQTILEIFRKSMDRFQNIQKNNSRPPVKEFLNSNISNDIRKMLLYDDFKQVVNYDLLQQISLVYIPSGGGKTTLKNKFPKLYKDVDDIVKENYELFQKVQELIKKFKRYKSFLMNKFYKYCLSKIPQEELSSKIFLMNHPNQVPNWMKFRRNELILIPNVWRVRTRFFCENLSSLLLTYRYVKKIINPDLYQDAINSFFRFEDRVIKDKSPEPEEIRDNISINSDDLWF